MARLSISLLGPFQVMLDGRPVRGFKSNKVRALLAYLAVEAARPHPREVMAGLLWPEWPDKEALSNLRYALSNLRRVIGDRARAEGGDADPPFLLVRRGSLQFNTASDHWLDVVAFGEMSGVPGMPETALEEALGLYRGGFLDGFSISGCAAFEEWVLRTRERLARQVSAALHHLAETYEQQAEYEKAQSFAWRQIELESWDEVAHQQLMRAFSLSGQRSAALAQYESCRRSLAEELGVEPARETTRLYEQIRDGELRALGPLPSRVSDPAAECPPFLDGEPIEVESAAFVARERELAKLYGFLDLALAGQGRVVFVTGEAGSGKTTLVEEFARRAQDLPADPRAGSPRPRSGQAEPALLVAKGDCNAQFGIGDPYLPFREILGLLSGDVEARWAAGAISREHARLLWNTLPLTAQALVEAGPDLVGTFVPGPALVERAFACTSVGADWLAALEELVGRKATVPGGHIPYQSDLFEQYTRVLQALARRVPLVLVVDDLQWADLGSISLLFHLGRHLTGSRILVVGVYRSEEVALGRADPLSQRQALTGKSVGERERHPLEPVVNELQRQYGDMVVDVAEAEGRAFVEALLDSEPNRMGPTFREMLYRQTRGHPLFTVELLRGLRERGDVIRDAEGWWVEGPSLDWETLPARVEAVIAERIGRLSQRLRAVLRVASVEGGVFTAEAVARVQGTEGRTLLGRLSGELDRQHRLIRADSIQRINGQILSRYRFRHTLFQRYLYSSLDQVEQVHLHEQVGTALEELYGAQEGMAASAAVAVQLSRHFREAGIPEKAIGYLLQAAERALQLSAYQEAIDHLGKGLALFETLPEAEGQEHRLKRDRQELALQLAFGKASIGCGLPTPEVAVAYDRARELCQQMGEISQLCQVLGELSTYYYVRAEHARARELAEEALGLAQSVEDPLHEALGHWYLGLVLTCLGEYKTALAHLEKTIAFYDPHEHHDSIVLLRGSDAGLGAMGYAICCQWCLGYPEQALARNREALALARELDHPWSLVDVLCYGGCVFNSLRRDARALRDDADELVRLSVERGVSGWYATGYCFQGEAVSMLGQAEEGMALIQEGLEATQSIGVLCQRPTHLSALSVAQAAAGHPEEALATLDEALSLVKDTDERRWEAELCRLRAGLLLASGDTTGAEASLHKAIEVARRQSAKSWELRATTSLARLWRQQGKEEEAWRALEEIYGWFTEGHGTRDLVEAKALLDELSADTD